jgi:hypothetical protein
MAVNEVSYPIIPRVSQSWTKKQSQSKSSSIEEGYISELKYPPDDKRFLAAYVKSNSADTIDQAMTDFTGLGGDPAGVTLFLAMGGDWDISSDQQYLDFSVYAKPFCDKVHARHKVPWIKLLPYKWKATGGWSNSYSLVDINKGFHDTYFRNQFGIIKSMGYSVIIEWAPEMNVPTNWDYRYPWSGVPEEYKRSFMHLIDLAKEVGAQNITWVFGPNWQPSDNIMEYWIPEVKVIAPHLFNFGVPWRTHNEMAQPCFSTIKSYLQTNNIQDVILGEGDVACAEKSGYDKSAWLNEWMQDLEGDFNYIKFVNYFSDKKVEEAVGEEVDWTPNSSAGAAASWAAGMAKSWWWPDEVAPDVTNKALDQKTGLLTFKVADPKAGIDWNNVKVIVTDERGNAVDTSSLTYNSSTGETSAQINMSKLSSGRRYIAEIVTTDNAGNSGIDPVVLKLEAGELTILDLHNYPNPFSPQKGETTTLVYIITQDPKEKVTNGATTSNVTIRIFDAAGESVKEIWDIPSQTGLNEVKWDGTNIAGEKVAPGIYFFTVWTKDKNDEDHLSPSNKPGKIAVR